MKKVSHANTLLAQRRGSHVMPSCSPFHSHHSPDPSTSPFALFFQLPAPRLLPIHLTLIHSFILFCSSTAVRHSVLLAFTFFATQEEQEARKDRVVAVAINAQDHFVFCQNCPTLRKATVLL
jgi:hypothetical protein